MEALKSCSFCEHLETMGGSGCETCYIEPYKSCALSNKTKQYRLEDEPKDLVVVAMKCKFFKWHPDILKIVEKGVK